MAVDYRKRAERRRVFYEQMQQDPTQFLQCHGRSVKVHLDATIAAAADKNMMPWPGDSKVLIDRFDGRAHLDCEMDFVKRNSGDNDRDDEPGVKDERERSRINYERYRILVQNDFLKINEGKFLRTIDLEEQYGVQTYNNATKKTAKEDKKLKEKNKAAIGFIYEDSSVTIAPPKSSTTMITPSESCREDEDASEASDIDLDVSVDLTVLPFEARAELNNLSTVYKMDAGDFCKYMNKDLEEQQDAREAKRLEEENANLAGKKSRRERRMLKERRKRQRRNLSPLNSITSKKGLRERRSRSKSGSSSSSSSSNNEHVETGRVEYITSFGNDNDMKEEDFELLKRRRSNRQRWSTRKEPRRGSGRRGKSRERSNDRRPRHQGQGRQKERRSTSRRRRTQPSSSDSSDSSGSSINPTAYRSKYRNRRRSSSSNSNVSDKDEKVVEPDNRDFDEKAAKQSSNGDKVNENSEVVNKSKNELPDAGTSRDEANTINEVGAPPRKSYYQQIRERHKDELSFSSENCDDGDDDSTTKSDKDSTSTTPQLAEGAKAKAGLDVKNKIKKRMKAQLNKLFKEEKQLEDERKRREEEERVEREEQMRLIASKLRAKEREKRHRENDSNENRRRPDERDAYHPRDIELETPHHSRQRSRSPKQRRRSKSPRRRRSPSISPRRNKKSKDRRSRSRSPKRRSKEEGYGRKRERRSTSKGSERRRLRKEEDRRDARNNGSHSSDSKSLKLVDY